MEVRQHRGREARSGALELRRLVLAVAAASAAVTASPGAFAQADDGVEEVVVTGSRIRRTSGMTTPVPVTAITTDELAVFDPGGTVAEQLDALPQFFANRSAQSSTGALNAGSGSSYLNLRDLGPRRTLVLFDGSRIVPADIQGSVDIDTFPTALIRSVDVVTGGASAAYGADALGGVVNFVLDREFEGLEIDAGTGVTDFGDGERWNFSIAGGKAIGDRVNFIGSLELMQIDQILRNPEELDGDWWKRWDHVTNPEWFPGAPPGIPQRLTLPWVSSTLHTPTGMIWSDSEDFAFNGYTFLEDGSGVRPFVHGDVYAAPDRPGTTRTQSGGPEGEIANRAFEGGPYGAEVVGRSGFAAVQYRFNDNVSAFAQVLLGRSETNTKDRRSQYTLQGLWAATIFRDNAYLPEEVGAAMDAAGIDSFELHKAGAFLGDNNIGLGDGRESFTTYSWSIGVDAVLPNGWDLRASWQSGESRNKAGLYGQTRIDRMFLGMDAVRDPDTGEIVCRVQLFNPTPEDLAAAPVLEGRESVAGGPLLSPIGLDGSIENCVPYNVMGAGNMSDEAVQYTQSPRVERSTVEQDFAEIVVNGDVAEGWAGPIGLAAGLTYREQSLVQRVESSVYAFGPPLNAPELGIQGIAAGYEGGSETLHRFSSLRNAEGEYDVWEWFGELNVPLWKADSGSRRLDSSLAYRSSDYSSNDDAVESWKVGLDYQVLEGLRLRATKSRDVREAAFVERFNNRGGGGANIDDPRVEGATYLITVRSGGNPNLRPEVADTLTAGLVYQPRAVSGLQLALDWYEVDVHDSIGSLGAQRIVNECAETGSPDICAQIERDPDTGLITRVHDTYLNVDRAKVEGIDLEVTYSMEPDFFGGQSESLSLRALGGYIIERSDTPLGGEPLDVAGQLGTPDFTGVATLRYNAGPYTVQLQQRYIAETILDVEWVEGVDVDDNTVASGNYTNLRLIYSGETAGGKLWDVSLNVTNLFDRHPPIVPGQDVPNGGYDIFGRRYQISAGMSF